MTPLPVIANTYRCALNWKMGVTSNAVNVMHVRKTGSSAAAVFANLDAHWTQDMNSLTTIQAHIDSVQITPLDGSSSTVVFPTDGTDKWKGRASGDGVLNTCHLLKLNTALRGRSHRGRLFLPFIAEGVLTGAAVDPTLRGEEETAWITFVADMATDLAELVVASYKLSQAFSLASIHVESRAGTQRRRLSRSR